MFNYQIEELQSIPPVMRKRAEWARNEILNNPKKVEVDYDELLAWVYHEEDNLWYSIAGNYSHSSPDEKMAKRKERNESRDEWNKKSEIISAERTAEQKYYSEVRNRILERDNWTCQKCGQKIERLEVHHIIKRIKGRVDADDNLITLCCSCHRKTDGKEYGLYNNGKKASRN